MNTTEGYEEVDTSMTYEGVTERFSFCLLALILCIFAAVTVLVAWHLWPVVAAGF